MSGQRVDKWPTIAEAAEIEGTTTEAMRKRIKRDRVDAQKVDGRWRVNPDSLSGQHRTKSDIPSGQDRTGDDDETSRDVVDVQRKYIERLENELDQRNAELKSLHVRLNSMDAQLERMTRALPVPEDDDASRGQAQSGQSPARWWHRLTRK